MRERERKPSIKEEKEGHSTTGDFHIEVDTTYAGCLFIQLLLLSPISLAIN